MDDPIQLPGFYPPEPVLTPPPAPRIGVRTRALDSGVDLVAALGLGFGAILLAALIAFALDMDVGALGQRPIGIAGMLLATQLPLVYIGRVRRKKTRANNVPVAELFTGPIAPALRAGFLAGLGLTVFSVIYTGTLQQFLGEGAVRNQVAEFLKNALADRVALAVLIFLIALVAPLCEEFFFRGVIYGSPAAAGEANVGIALSAVLFAAVHMNLALAPFYVTFGWVMCRLFASHRTLAAPIAAHMTMNGIACLALVIGVGRSGV